ncbi:unnamed protein product, partial [Dibothriocephalus latus]
MKPKAPLSTGETANVVYRIQCSSCEVNYVGITGERLQTRMTEHEGAVQRQKQRSLVAQHCAATGHAFAFKDVVVLGRGSDQTAGETLEAWHNTSNAINRCVKLPAAYQASRVKYKQHDHGKERRSDAPANSTNERARPSDAVANG